MNKSFKVLWNRFRNSYVVASEATASQGKAGKAAKTVLTAAVVGAMALGGVATAKTITNDSFGSDYSSTKFVSGNTQDGESLVIQTNGDARALLQAINQAIKAKDWDAIRGALGTANGATLVGLAGGQNYVDQTTVDSLNKFYSLSKAISEVQPSLVPESVGKILEKWNTLVVEGNIKPLVGNVTGTLHNAIGGNGSNPLLIATTAGDRLINASLTYGEGAPGGNLKQEFVRTGDIITETQSGNLISFVGGSSSINVSGITGKASILGVILKAPTTAAETHVTVDGSTSISLGGTTSSAGLIGGSAAIALGGISSATVTGGSTITIATDTNHDGYEGVSAGVIGGGLSAAVMGGESTTAVNGKTTIDIQKGLVVGAIGGGAAVSGEISPIVDSVLNGALGKYKNNLEFGENLEQGGSATAISGDIAIKVGSESSAFGLVGGGLAAAQSMYDSTKGSSSTVTAGNVTITIGHEGAAPVFEGETPEEIENAKSEFFGKLHGVLDDLQSYLENSESVGEFDLVKNAVDALNKPGVTVGVLGGGIALAYQANNGQTEFENTATAVSNVSTVNINVKSGYNVGIFGSGLAAGSAASIGEDTLNAVSTVDSSTITLGGGETIGVMGGGISYFTGTSEPNTGIGAQATTGTVTIGVTGDASVDGIVGGGLAIDDTNPLGEDGNPVATKLELSISWLTPERSIICPSRLLQGKGMTIRMMPMQQILTLGIMWMPWHMPWRSNLQLLSAVV